MKENEEIVDEQEVDPMLDAIIGIVNKIDKLDEIIDKLDMLSHKIENITVAEKMPVTESAAFEIYRTSRDVAKIYEILKPKPTIWKRFKYKVGYWVSNKVRKWENEDSCE